MGQRGSCPGLSGLWAAAEFGRVVLLEMEAIAISSMIFVYSKYLKTVSFPYIYIFTIIIYILYVYIYNYLKLPQSHHLTMFTSSPEALLNCSMNP
jgi:hypothetical protein